MLLDKGQTESQILAAVCALSDLEHKEREERRANLREGNRLRQQKFRESRRAERNENDARNSVTENYPSPNPSPNKEIPPTPPKENNPNQSPSLPSRLPADFELSDEDRAFGEAEGLSDEEISRSVEDMRLWAAEAVGEKALRADWHATARRFMRRDADAKRAAKPNASRDGAKTSERGKVIELKPNEKPQSTPATVATVATVALAQESKPRTVFVKRDSPQGEAWWRYTKAKTGKTPPMDKNGGWYFSTEWPPNPAAQQAGATAGIGAAIAAMAASIQASAAEACAGVFGFLAPRDGGGIARIA
jgi:hypothetical protein